MGPAPVQASAIDWRRGSALGFRTPRARGGVCSGGGGVRACGRGGERRSSGLVRGEGSGSGRPERTRGKSQNWTRRDLGVRACRANLRVERRHLPEPDQATRAHHCKEGLSGQVLTGKVSSKTAQNHSISRFGFGKLRRVMTGLRKLVSISGIYLEM
jgi:hypothetical protein